MTISAGNASRALLHQGVGLLKMYSLTIADGRYQIAGNAYGGCIHSSGAVELQRVTVTDCKVIRIKATPGGALSAPGGDVTLFSSHIEAN